MHVLFLNFCFFAALTYFLTLSDALVTRDDGSANVIQLPIQRGSTVNSLIPARLSRRGSVNVDLRAEATLYFIECSVGTPPVKIRLHLDTGSSDMWLNTPTSPICQSISGCASGGVYAANVSSTYKYVNSDFNISYVDNSGAAGDYATDTLALGDVTLADFQFGIGYESSSDAGVLGIGYQALETQVQRYRRTTYENLPARLVAAGHINSNAYSLFMDNLDASTGSILFGGIDTERFEGSLATIPVQQMYGTYLQLLVTLTALSLGSESIATDQALPVLIDSGTSLTYLPNSIVSHIYRKISAIYDPSVGRAYVNCSLAESPDMLVFTFSEPAIRVPMSEMVIPVFNSYGRPSTFKDERQACFFGVVPSGNGTILLGDTFIRSAYLVYDLDNNEISMAQIRLNSTASNVLEIGKGSDAVPHATAVKNAVSATGLPSTLPSSQPSSGAKTYVSSNHLLIINFLLSLCFILV